MNFSNTKSDIKISEITNNVFSELNGVLSLVEYSLNYNEHYSVPKDKIIKIIKEQVKRAKQNWQPVQPLEKLLELSIKSKVDGESLSKYA